MQQTRNRCTLHVYASGGHGWGFRENFRHHRQMVSDLNHWLSELKMK
jgi:hypothetical protein